MEAGKLVTFVLVEALNSKAPIYQQLPGGKKAKIEKLPSWRPYLRITFQGIDGRSKTIRYKETADSIDQREQIDKQKIEANIPWTPTEYKDMEFKNGMCMIRKPIGIEFLRAYPACEGFVGTCSEQTGIKYREFDITAEKKSINRDMRTRIEAASKVLEFDKNECIAVLSKIHGTSYQAPVDLDDCQQEIIEYFDKIESDKIEELLEKGNSIDDEIRVLVNKLVNQGVISFTQKENEVSQKNEIGKWVSIKTVSSSYPVEERERMFVSFLSSKQGDSLYESLSALDIHPVAETTSPEAQANDIVAKAKEEARQILAEAMKVVSDQNAAEDAKIAEVKKVVDDAKAANEAEEKKAKAAVEKAADTKGNQTKNK